MRPHYLLWMNEFAICSNNPELMLIDAYSKGVVSSRMDEIDPNPLFTRLSLHDLQLRMCLGAVFYVCVLMAWDQIPAASLVASRSTSTFEVLGRFAPGSTSPVMSEAIGVDWDVAGVTEANQIHVHRLIIPVSNDDVA
ncbi:uncharacterized protein ColSpa_01270 [Colletotrichum spaethianum]|uniref:Uncharacterized protein n=1 Tax=Colletotrichum spaethianum TaxID=700344 RepID=A0AA37P6Y5_9PEZI|nr:uncharacterized protein ColSpa_01270 [Colletotrichum spaethianum]GKT41089.1 hypothetical protein ColSpa_01270 [Colletotrichum spaethianum]